MRRLKLFLDANVIVDAQVRDFLCTASELGLIDLRWSGQVLEEVERALVNRLGLDGSKVRRLLMVLASAFPNAVVDGFESEVSLLDLPDADDRHVLAAAIHDECDLLVTNNVDDFPEERIPSAADLGVVTADEVISIVASAFPEEMLDLVDAVLGRLQRPSLDVEQYLKILESRTGIVGAVTLGAVLGVGDYDEILSHTVRAHDEDGPFGQVKLLLELLGSESAVELSHLLDPALAARLTGATAPSPAALMRALHELLGEAINGDDWGFPTRTRVVSPDTEIVKLLKMGRESEIFRRPTFAEDGHIFYLRFTGGRWLIVDINKDDPGLADVLPNVQP